MLVCLLFCRVEYGAPTNAGSGNDVIVPVYAGTGPEVGGGGGGGGGGAAEVAEAVAAAQLSKDTGTPRSTDRSFRRHSSYAESSARGRGHRPSHSRHIRYRTGRCSPSQHSPPWPRQAWTTAAARFRVWFRAQGRHRLFGETPTNRQGHRWRRRRRTACMPEADRPRSSDAATRIGSTEAPTTSRRYRRKRCDCACCRARCAMPSFSWRPARCLHPTSAREQRWRTPSKTLVETARMYRQPAFPSRRTR